MVYGDNKGLEVGWNWLFYPVEHYWTSVRRGPMRSEASIALLTLIADAGRIPVDPGALGEEDDSHWRKKFPKNGGLPL
jgi:hypothetical protein